MGRRWVRRTGALLAVLALVVLGAGPSTAQVLPPLPPLPPAPEDGSLLSDVLGPSATSTCDAVATVEALAGPIISAQLPPDLQVVVEEVTPYLSLVSYVCSLVVTAPTGNVCSADDALGEQLGVLGLPVSFPAPFQIALDTAAGIEHVFLRLGVDVGTEVSRQLAAALGCALPPPPTSGPAAPLPPAAPPIAPPAPPAPAPALDVGPSLAPATPLPTTGPTVASARPAAGSPPIPGVLGLADARYPVDGLAALLLALPLLGLGGAIAVGPRLVPAARRARRRSPS